MKKQQIKKQTLKMIDEMINLVQYGPSGFWVDDDGGCGNPKIFPEFEEGLRRGILVQEEHCICPWNTAVMYGEGYGNINTGCYYSCSINEARYLPEQTLKAVLLRFKKRLESGKYDSLDNLKPLLVQNEIKCIEKRKIAESKRNIQKEKKLIDNKRKKAAALLKKYGNDEDLKEMITTYYETNVCIDGIDFSPFYFNKIVGGENLSYNDYLDIQIKQRNNSDLKVRYYFKLCAIYTPMGFSGEIEQINSDKICFKRILVSGMYPDGKVFYGKEEHVWMDRADFEEFKVGDFLSFFADVYVYLRKGNGKSFDYGLRNPQMIERIEKYKLPCDRDLQIQNINQIICESCWYNGKCNGFCIRDRKELDSIRESMLETLKNNRREPLL